MSDLEKVVSFARMLGHQTPIQLRWEGAGDAAHAATLLQALQRESYAKRGGAINYNAVINCYEPETSDIFKRAKAQLVAAHKDAWDSQTWTLLAGKNLERASHETPLPKAHIMFVRNIMTTSDGKDSETTAAEKLLALHQGGLRNRANSLTEKGQLRLGMSGSPGLTQGETTRSNATHEELFHSAKELEATTSKLYLLNALSSTTGAQDVDESVDVMKNDGSALKTLSGDVKKTFYLTFIRGPYTKEDT